MNLIDAIVGTLSYSYFTIWNIPGGMTGSLGRGNQELITIETGVKGGFDRTLARALRAAVAPVSRERSRCEDLLAVSANFAILTVIVAEYSRNIDNQVSNNINRGSGLL